MPEGKRDVGFYRSMFFAHNGPGPWICYFCDKKVAPHWDTDGPLRVHADGLVIHHIDEDFCNNTPKNLTAAHNGCHARHHQRELHLEAKRSDEAKSNISAGIRKRLEKGPIVVYTDERRKKLSNSLNSYWANTPGAHEKHSKALKDSWARRKAQQ